MPAIYTTCMVNMIEITLILPLFLIVINYLPYLTALLALKYKIMMLLNYPEVKTHSIHSYQITRTLLLRFPVIAETCINPH